MDQFKRKVRERRYTIFEEDDIEEKKDDIEEKKDDIEEKKDDIEEKKDQLIIQCQKKHKFRLTIGEMVVCPICPRSKGEQAIEEYLFKNEYKYRTKFGSPFDYRPEYPVDIIVDGKRKRVYYDFLLPNQKLLIEFDGAQHYEDSVTFKTRAIDQKANDQLKDQWAKEHNYQLLRIPYWREKEISEILRKILI